MTKDDIAHLGALARLALSPEEMERLPKEIDAIISYVSAVQSIVGTETIEPHVGARYNILRPDEVVEEAGAYTDILLKAAPRREGDYLVINKILQQDE